MSYRLKGTDLQNFFKLCTDYRRYSGAKIKFYAASDSDGRRVNEIIKKVYSKEYQRVYKGFAWVIGNYKDFTVTFYSSADCKKVYEDIEGAMEAYGASGAGTALDEGGDEGGGLGKNATTYIIIGAVVLVLGMLIFTRKRK